MTRTICSCSQIIANPAEDRYYSATLDWLRSDREAHVIIFMITTVDGESFEMSIEDTTLDTPGKLLNHARSQGSIVGIHGGNRKLIAVPFHAIVRVREA